MNQITLEQKKIIRKQLLDERNNLNKDYKSAYDTAICKLLEEKIQEHKMSVIHCYLPMGQEVDLYPLIIKLLEKGVKVVSPKTLPKRQLENRVLKSLDDLESGPMGTKHPAGNEVYSGNYDLIIVPGLAFDKDFYRLGYGGGYYDIFLAQHPEALKIGVFYPFQKMDKLPREEHDVRLDEIYSIVL